MTIVLGVALLVPQYALTWHGRGHMMVAAVAYQKLNQATKDRVDALLLLNPDRDNWFDLIPATTSAPKRKMMVFMIAATWADRIKSDPDYHTDGTHNGNRPPNECAGNRLPGFVDDRFTAFNAGALSAVQISLEKSFNSCGCLLCRSDAAVGLLEIRNRAMDLLFL